MTESDSCEGWSLFSRGPQGAHSSTSFPFILSLSLSFFFRFSLWSRVCFSVRGVSLSVQSVNSNSASLPYRKREERRRPLFSDLRVSFNHSSLFFISPLFVFRKGKPLPVKPLWNWEKGKQIKEEWSDSPTLACSTGRGGETAWILLACFELH